MSARPNTPAILLAKYVPEAAADDCWPWQGTVTNHGYGQAVIRRQRFGAHRFVYEQLIGPIPAGLDLDHICHEPTECAGGPACPHRACVNPSHLVPTTARRNVLRSNSEPAKNLRKPLCANGHEFSHTDSRGWRKCRTCQRDRWRAKNWSTP